MICRREEGGTARARHLLRRWENTWGGSGWGGRGGGEEGKEEEGRRGRKRGRGRKVGEEDEGCIWQGI